jgi:hypothetical protein
VQCQHAGSASCFMRMEVQVVSTMLWLSSTVVPFCLSSHVISVVYAGMDGRGTILIMHEMGSGGFEYMYCIQH